MSEDQTQQEEPQPATGEEKVEETPPLTIIWRGEGDPPSKVKIGMFRIELPDAATQRAGFEHEQATLILESVTGYKRLQPKG